MKRFLPPFAAATLLALVACGGGSSSPSTGGASGGNTTGSSLTYVNPANTQGQFALVLDTAASTASTLVLDLVGPETNPATYAIGVSFGFNVDTTRATWAATPVVNGTVFNLGSGVQLARGWVNGQSLQGIVSNKGVANQVADIGSGQGVIGKIQLTPVQGGPSGTVSLSDNGLGSFVYYNAPAGIQPNAFQVLVGTLTLN